MRWYENEEVRFHVVVLAFVGALFMALSVYKSVAYFVTGEWKCP